MSDNPERLSFPFHLGGPGIITADKQFSIYVSRTLDVLGKNQDMIKYRVKMWREWQKYQNVIHRGSQFEKIMAGSKAEGLTSLFESDTDMMIVLPDVICADNVRPFMHNRNNTVLQTDKHDSHAGYTKLKLVKFKGLYSISLLYDSLFDNESEDKYLASDLFVTTIGNVILEGNQTYNTTGSMNLHERSGPSLPISDPEGYSHEDKVFAFRCFCPTLLQSFLTRPRPYNRPSCDELREISGMDTHVVPVGHQGSNESHNEWRICFTKAEIYLVQKLNEAETKLYIILKLVSNLLEFITKDITSYVMKNIVLWLVELYPVYSFTEDFLTYQLIQALRFLQKCVEVNFLPSYMIPERNLLADRLDPTQKLKLTTFLSTLIQERGYLLLRCEKLRYGMVMLYREPDMAEEFRRRRDMTEKLRLVQDNIIHENMAATGLSREEIERLLVTHGINRTIINALIKVVFPDMMFLIWQRYSVNAIVNLYREREIQLLS